MSRNKTKKSATTSKVNESRLSLGQFTQRYRLAALEDFKYGLKWFTMEGRADEDALRAQAVEPTNNLAQDASKFNSAVLRQSAYLPVTSAAKKAAPKKAPKPKASKPKATNKPKAASKPKARASNAPRRR